MARKKVDTSKTDNVVEKQVGEDLNRARDAKRAAEDEGKANIDYDKQQSYGRVREYEQAGPLARTDWQGAASNNETERSLTTRLNNEREEDPTAVYREFTDADSNFVVGGNKHEKNETNTDNNAAAGGNENAGNGNAGGKVEVKTETNTNTNAGNTNTNTTNTNGNTNTNTDTNTNTNSSAGFGNLPDPKTNNVPKGYNEVQQNQVGQSSGTSESTGSQQSEGHSNGTSVKTFDAEANAAARKAGQDYVNDGPSGYQEALNELGVGEGGPKEKLLQEKLEQGIPFAQAIQEIATQGDADAKAKAEKLAKTKNTMANLMESFRLATDMASGFTGGNIYKRDGNEKIVAENKRELDAADRKYQKALDDFNNNMRRLKSEDLADRRQRAAKLGDVGFGTETNQESTNNTNTQNHTEQQNTQTQSNNQFVQDQEYAANQSVRVAYAQGAGGKPDKNMIVVKRPYYDKNGQLQYEREEVRWDESAKARVRSEIYNYLTDEAMNDENSEIYRQMSELCRINGIGSGKGKDFKPNFDTLKKILNNNGEGSGYKDMYEPLLLNAYSMFSNTDKVMHPVERKEGEKTKRKTVTPKKDGVRGESIAPVTPPMTGEGAFEQHQ